MDSRNGSLRSRVPAAGLSVSIVLLGVVPQPVLSSNRAAARTIAIPAEASISGRVVAEAGADIRSAVGLRVSASDRGLRSIAATVAYDWSFRMTLPPGFYSFSVAADR